MMEVDTEELVLIEFDQFQLIPLTSENVERALEVYNSNEDFLVDHLGETRVPQDWLTEELHHANESGFTIFGVHKTDTGDVLGIIDLGLFGDLAYLSLLILKKDAQRKGVGSEIFQNLELFLKKKKMKTIRLDVVKGRGFEGVLAFWKHHGFVEQNEIIVKWRHRRLPACAMKKDIAPEGAPKN